MFHASYGRIRSSTTRFVPVLLLMVLSGGVAALAQDTAPAIGQPADVERLQTARRDAMLGLAEWDHTMLGAFQLGARLMRLSDETAVPSEAVSIFRPVAEAVRFSASAPRASLNSVASAFRLDQLSKQGMNLRMNSPFGSFRLQYREIFSGRANSLGGGVGQASAAATFTTPKFGNGMFDFSAAALMGTGSINTMLGSGFGNSAIGGFGPVLRKNPGPTVALKLTF
jgi:hypothetical protein